MPLPPSTIAVTGDLEVNKSTNDVADPTIKIQNGGGDAEFLSFYNGAGSTQYGNFRLNNGDDGIDFNSVGNLEISTNGTKRLEIDTSGKVGIGTSPNVDVEIQGSGNTTLSSKGNLFVADGGTASQAAEEGGQITFGAWLNGDLSAPYPMASIKGITESSTTNTNTGALIFGTTAGSGAVERMRIDSSGNLKFNSGFGSVGTAYGCRAWVQFNSNGTILGSANVTSVTDQATGKYSVNFTTAMPDANYAVQTSGRNAANGAMYLTLRGGSGNGPATGSV